MLCARGAYFPVAQIVLTSLQCFKLLPTVIATFVKPHGHVFKVTPKGSAAKGPGYESDVFWASAVMLALTVAGIIINAFPDTRIVPPESDMTVAFTWAGVNVIVLFLVCMTCLTMPTARGEERIPFADTVWLRRADGRMARVPATDISVTGVGVAIDPANPFLADLAEGERLNVAISEVGQLDARVMSRRSDTAGFKFLSPSWLERDLLLRRTFTRACNPRAVSIGVVQASLAILARIVTLQPLEIDETAEPEPPASPPAPEEKLEAQSLAIQPWARGEITAHAAQRRFAGPGAAPVGPRRTFG
jgi:cellulose synthase (UDP-forming)